MAAEAGANRGLTTGIAVADNYALDSASRELWFNETAEANADLIRIDVVWRESVGSQRPANPRDPADAAYDFADIDAAVREAQERGLKVLLMMWGAPDWATGANAPDGASPGTWRPDAGEYGDFATALAKRYSGNFSPGGGQPPLPRVRYFEPWNEPNLEDFLAPQWVGNRPEGPAIYRALLDSFSHAVNAVDPQNKVVGPATAPFGAPIGSDPGVGDRMRPVRFLRELFCLEGRMKLEPRPGCPRVQLDVLSHHPISLENAPTYSAINPDDAATSDLGRLTRVLKAAERAGVVRPGGKRPIWVTEFWWISEPSSSAIAVPERTQARYIEQALYVFWKQRVRVAIQYLIRDLETFQTGLFFADGEEKLALRAFRFPFVTEPLPRRRVRAWGRSPVAGRLRIQGQNSGGWTTLKRVRVRRGEVFTAKLRGRKMMRAQIGGEESLVW
jgi:hypothetical protein